MAINSILAICARDLAARGRRTSKQPGCLDCDEQFRLFEGDGVSRDTSHTISGWDRYVIQEMLKQEANLGGEQSGHLIFLDQNTTGDGIVSALQVLKIMIETETRLSDLAAFVTKYPQVLLNVKVHCKPALEDLTLTSKAISKGESELGEGGRVVVRHSGTELTLRVMVEGKNPKLVSQIAHDIADSAQKEIGSRV